MDWSTVALLVVWLWCGWWPTGNNMPSPPKMSGMHEKLRFRCSEGHEWLSTPSNLTYKNVSCFRYWVCVYVCVVWLCTTFFFFFFVQVAGVSVDTAMIVAYSVPLGWVVSFCHFVCVVFFGVLYVLPRRSFYASAIFFFFFPFGWRPPPPPPLLTAVF